VAHRRTTHKDCPLLWKVPLEVTPVTSQQQIIKDSAADPFHSGDGSEVEDVDSEREEEVR
jgi:hypothetical protein